MMSETEMLRAKTASKRMAAAIAGLEKAAISLIEASIPLAEAEATDGSEAARWAAGGLDRLELVKAFIRRSVPDAWPNAPVATRLRRMLEDGEFDGNKAEAVGDRCQEWPTRRAAAAEALREMAAADGPGPFADLVAAPVPAGMRRFCVMVLTDLKAHGQSDEVLAARLLKAATPPALRAGPTACGNATIGGHAVAAFLL